MPETLHGLIERVTYHNTENGFAVLKVQVKGRQDLVTVNTHALGIPKIVAQFHAQPANALDNFLTASSFALASTSTVTSSPRQ